MHPDAQRVAEMMAQGRKIEAIKLLRELTGMGLAEAKSAVERLEAGEPLPPFERGTARELPEDVRQLASTGHAIEAVKRLRERTGMSLKDAKELVDSVPLKLEAKRGGCGAGVLLLVAGLTTAILI